MLNKTRGDKFLNTIQIPSSVIKATIRAYSVVYMKDSDMTTPCSSLRTDVSEEYIASIFRVRDSDSPWFEAGVYLMGMGESLLLRCRLYRVYVLPWRHSRQVTNRCFFGCDDYPLIADKNERFDVFTAVTMKDAVFWGTTMPCSSSKKRCFGITYRLHLQSERLRVPLVPSEYISRQKGNGTSCNSISCSS
jgi:hypothetical protein